IYHRRNRKRGYTMEVIVIALFCIILLTCVIFDISIVLALFAGLFLFLCYGKYKGFAAKELA
ncbi:MAG: hypothetical protein IJW74_05840, partial [Oscillospiraceae bacterium]|nr:hypothetical protein [Oscillospiraceae bacterium]